MKLPERVFVWFGKTSPDGGLKYHLDCLYEIFPDRTVPIFSENFPDDISKNDLVIPFIVPTVSELKEPSVTQLLKTPATVIVNLTWECPYIHYRHLTSFLRADYITFPSNYLSVLFPHRRTKTIPLPIKEYKRRGKRERSYRIGCVISAHPRKNHKGWVELVNKLRPPWKVSFVFHHWQWELLPQEFRLLRNNPQVEFIEGPISEKEMEEFYHSLDWYVSLSVGEGYDLPVREALKCGVPVIVGKHTGHLDLPNVSGIVYYPTVDRDGAAYELPVTVVKAPVIDEVVSLINETSPPEVDDTITLPTMKDWRTMWTETYNEALNITVRVERETKLVFLRPINYYCGLRAVTDLWAKRVGSPVVNITDAPKLSLPPQTIILFPYYYGFLVEGRNLYPLLTLRMTNPTNPLIVWSHSVMEERELSVLISLGAKFVATSPYVAGMLPNALVLPNPIGDPPKRPPEEKTIVCWGLGRVHLENEVDNILNLISTLPNWKFILVFTPAVADPEIRKFVLTINHIRKRMSDIGGEHEVISHHLSDDELEDILERGSVYLIPLATGSLGNISGELTARVPLVLRKERPILCPYNPDRLGPYMTYVRPISPWNSQTLHQYITNSVLLKEMKPKGVMSIEDEISMFWDVVNRLLQSNNSSQTSM